ncbi:hypothetical protein GCM10010971_18630 [Silvimonas amylolytica]|uniref:Uncharacterized protein n=2 Tax=Silvimonas amylolytica TaxID=449663 RepID=A0ABQ2PKA5_9NEIS|nr:hypothetical protein GCM10010971_18630 [Silvimonas amylolytica]
MTRAYAEPQSGARARLRVVTTGEIRLIPGRDCHDEYAPGAGVVATQGYDLADHHLNGRKLGMPDEPATDQRGTVSEVFVTAGQPVEVNFISQQIATGTSNWVCNLKWSFVPEAGKDYVSRSSQSFEACSLSVTTLDGQSVGHRDYLNACPAK